MGFFARLWNRIIYSEFFRVFNWNSPEARGRVCVLLSNFMGGIGNVLITGIFYTGFLAANGIDIVRVGIISFIPYIAWAFSLFSPMILSRFKRRRYVLVVCDSVYYVCVVLATTIMPRFVQDEGAKTLLFGIFLFIGNVTNALLGSASSAFQLPFLPKDNENRNIYFSWQNLVSVGTNSVVAIVSSLIADALAGSPQQAEFITVMRYVAFFIFTANYLCFYLIPKEYPIADAGKRVTLVDVFRIPLKAPKFMMMVLVIVAWNAISNVNANTWNYYMQTTVGAGYLVMWTCTLVRTVFSFFTFKPWRKAIAKFGWFNVLAFTVLGTGILELMIGFSTAETIWWFVIVSALQGILAVGTGLVFANLFYVNLPEGSTDIFATFWNFVANVSVFIGSSLGTLFISWTERMETARGGPVYLFNLPFYGSQFLVWIKFVLFGLLFVYIIKRSKAMQPDPDNPI